MSCENQGPKAATECGPCSPGLRNRYFRGKLLTVADYQAEQAYLIGRRRLVAAGGLGGGVISGFKVERTGPASFEIGRGLAFDCHGRELVACEKVEIAEREDILWLSEGDCGLEPGATPEPGRYLLAAHYAERRIDGVRVEAGCGDTVCEANHVCETVVYSARRAEAPWCPPAVGGCEGLDPADQIEPAAPASKPAAVAHAGNLGAIGLCRDDRCGSCATPFDPCRIGRLSAHGGIELDCGAGVPLAYLLLDADACGGVALTEVIQIVRGCELTRIQDIGWRNWHEHPGTPISRESFDKMFVAPPPGGTRGNYPPVDTRFWVCFSAPVQIASLSRDVITMTLIQRSNKEAVGEIVRVPIEDLWIAPRLEGDPLETTRGLRPRVPHKLWIGEINSESSSGFERPTRVEIRIHGDLIVDWRGQALDANSIASTLPTGTGSPGGEFLSIWRVRADAADVPPRADNATTAV